MAKKVDTLEWVRAAVEHRVVKPYWLDSGEATPEDEMSARYAEVLRFMADYTGPIQVGLKGGIEACLNEDCPGDELDADGNVITPAVVRAVQVNIPGAFRVDACCLVCGESQVHRAGWDSDGQARDEYRKRTRSLLVG